MSAVRVRRDVIDEMRAALASGMRAGSADCDVNPFAEPVTLTVGLVSRAINEIVRLRVKVAENEA